MNETALPLIGSPLLELFCNVQVAGWERLPNGDFLVRYESCPPHPSDTAPSVSQQEQQGETTPTAQGSEGMGAGGNEQP